MVGTGFLMLAGLRLVLISAVNGLVWRLMRASGCCLKERCPAPPTIRSVGASAPRWPDRAPPAHGGRTPPCSSQRAQPRPGGRPDPPVAALGRLGSALSAPDRDAVDGILKAHNAGQVGLGEPLHLWLDAGLSAPQRLPASLQILGQPMSAMRPLERKADRLRLVEQPA